MVLLSTSNRVMVLQAPRHPLLHREFFDAQGCVGHPTGNQSFSPGRRMAVIDVFRALLCRSWPLPDAISFETPPGTAPHCGHP